jgi:hypothetical protein
MVKVLGRMSFLFCVFVFEASRQMDCFLYLVYYFATVYKVR